MDQDNSYHTPYDIDIKSLPDKPSTITYVRRVLSLPKKVVDIMFDPEIADLIEESFGPHFNLTPKQKRELTRIIRNVLLADLYFKKMPEIIQEKLFVNETTAKDLTKELLGKIFLAGWEDIKAMHDSKFETKEGSHKETPLSSPTPLSNSESSASTPTILPAVSPPLPSSDGQAGSPRSSPGTTVNATALSPSTTPLSVTPPANPNNLLNLKNKK